MGYGWREYDGGGGAGALVELCDECGFDARRVRDETGDLLTAFEDLADLLDHLDADRRPAAKTWSAREYVDHVVEVTEALLGLVADITHSDVKRSVAVTDLASAADAVLELVPSLDTASRAAVLHETYSQPVTAQWIVLHLLHDAQHHVFDLRRGYARLALADLPGEWDAGVPSKRELLGEIAARGRALPTLDPRTPDEIIGYDEHGLPS